MRIRSVTCFVGADEALADPAFDRAHTLNEAARATAESAGYVLQTTRIAAQPLGQVLHEIPAREFGRAFEKVYRALGFDYGALLLASPELYPDASALVLETESLFVSLAIASKAQGILFDAIRAAAKTVWTLGQSGGDGLGNFRFSAAANVPPACRFFPPRTRAQMPPALRLPPKPLTLR